MNDIKVFFLDLWHDLREKRLWPVAAGLLLAVIAVPVLLLDDAPKKGSSSTPAAGVAPAGTPGSPQPADLAAAEDVTSDLGQFDSKDPFEGGGGGESGAESSGSSASGGTVENIPGGPSSSSSSGGGGSTSVGTGGTEGDTLAPGGDTKNVPEGEEKQTDEKKTETEEKSTAVTPFSYTVDIDFGRAGNTHLRRDVTPLTLLPDKKRPLLVFMGITSSRKTAMFKVEGAVASLKGEGICLPSRKECNFLYLRSDEDHNVQFLTDTSGRRYTLKLHDINRVTSSDLAAKKSAKRTRDRARGATGVFVGER